MAWNFYICRNLREHLRRNGVFGSKGQNVHIAKLHYNLVQEGFLLLDNDPDKRP